MEQKKKMHWLTECLLALAAYAVLFFLMQYTLITAVLLAVPCIFVGARRGWLAGSAFLILCTALTWLFGGWLALLAGRDDFAACIGRVVSVAAKTAALGRVGRILWSGTGFNGSGSCVAA